jgi:hypothetical protein
MEFVIKEGYLGICGWCDEPATHHEWVEFEPLPAVPDLDLPELTGIWSPKCDKHCDPTQKHKEK